MRLPTSRFVSWKLLPALGCLALAGLGSLSGCKGFLDQTQIGRWEKEPLAVSILDELDKSMEEPDQRFITATNIRSEDLQPAAHDYVIGPNDMLTISVADLVQPGTETVKSTRVSESGNISLPYIGQVHATGRTEGQLETAIIDAMVQQGLMQRERAQVSVAVTEPRNRTYSVLGAINAPGEYAILKSDYRILDALVAGRQTTAPDIESLYVVRRMTDSDSTTQPATGPAMGTGTGTGAGAKPTGPVIPEPGATPAVTPRSGGRTTQPRMRSDAGAASTRPADMGERYVIGPDGKPMLINDQAANRPATAQTVTAEAMSPKAFEFNEPTEPQDIRVIRVPLQKLLEGHFQYNIVIRPGDMIIVPPPVSGVYFMGGHVARVGVYSLTNQRITLKQAIIGAGMLDGVAVPDRTDIVRRIGPNKEEYVRVDLAKIFEGSQPDFFLKPYDQVNVGTNIYAPFLAAIRGAFRITYGFGFLYDRNYNTSNNNNP